MSQDRLKLSNGRTRQEDVVFAIRAERQITFAIDHLLPALAEVLEPQNTQLLTNDLHFVRGKVEEKIDAYLAWYRRPDPDRHRKRSAKKRQADFR